MKISKKFELSVGHRLSNYSGKCRWVHGHNYHGELIISGERLDELGMLVDYGVLKEIIRDTIDARFDHKCVLKAEDSFNQKLIQAAKELNDDSFVVVDYNPTVENLIVDMQKMIVRAFEKRYPDRYFGVNLTLSETGSSNCEI
jgi:6-pyruvoyltetrahydropterin/6-carboxytetrahydropterin synthase